MASSAVAPPAAAAALPGGALDHTHDSYIDYDPDLGLEIEHDDNRNLYVTPSHTHSPTLSYRALLVPSHWFPLCVHPQVLQRTAGGDYLPLLVWHFHHRVNHL